MKLSPEDVALFYKLYHSLIIYFNNRKNILKGLNDPNDIKKFPLQEFYKIRDQLYDEPKFIEKFVSENPLNFSLDGLDIIRSWKHFIKDKFYVFKHLKKYSIFLHSTEDSKAFGVLALTTSFEETLGPYVPILVETVLLPFRDKIIYDSLFHRYSISFGRSIRTSMNDWYQNAKAKYGIITSLPHDSKKIKISDAEQLKIYMKSQRSREIYWDEIEYLINKDRSLRVLYHQEMGKINARSYKKDLKRFGIKNAWFAILMGVIVASGTTKDEVEKILDAIVPQNNREFIYIFHLKEK